MQIIVMPNYRVTADMCFNKPVTKEVPYWLSPERCLRNRISETYNITKMDPADIGWGGVNGIGPAQDRNR
jgi:hypothetical protein